MTNPAPLQDFDPSDALRNLAAKLASRTRHVNFLFGAGTSLAAGLPSMGPLSKAVVAGVADADRKQLAAKLVDKYGLEKGLSRLRRIRTLIDGTDVFEGMNSDLAQALEKDIVDGISRELTAPVTNLDASVDFATWVIGEYYAKPVEIFTLNYDLVFEMGLESVGAGYFDGFVGSIHARFRPDLIEPVGANELLPTSFARLWKLHGSINWLVTESGEVVRTGAPVLGSGLAAVLPSDQKYEESRRVPFVVLQDRLRNSLAEPESITVVCGYSFGDDHINELLLDAARRHPRSEIVVLCNSKIPAQLAGLSLPNVTVLASREGIIGGVRGSWAEPSSSLDSELFDEGALRIGSFSVLSTFLIRNRRVESVRPLDFLKVAVESALEGDGLDG